MVVWGLGNGNFRLKFLEISILEIVFWKFPYTVRSLGDQTRVTIHVPRQEAQAMLYFESKQEHSPFRELYTGVLPFPPTSISVRYHGFAARYLAVVTATAPP